MVHKPADFPLSLGFDMVHGTRNQLLNKKRTSKIIDRLTYCPAKHKKKQTKQLRKKLQDKRTPDPANKDPSTKLKIGSINLNGLDLETGWAVEQLITNYELDASINVIQI